MKQNGIIMIEVLIALVILAFGILGLASLQAYSLKAAQASYLRSVATDLATGMAEQIRVNRSSKSALVEGGQAVDETGKAIPMPPDYARLVCSYDTNDKKYSCAKPSGYTKPEAITDANQALAEKDVARWLDLVKASLPLGTTGGAVICKDDSPDDGSIPVFDPLNAGYNDTADGSGCLLPTDANYATAPYVIKIWWEDEKPRLGNETPPLTRFATTL